MQADEIEVMRRAHGVVRSATVGLTVGQVTGPNDRRIALLFTGPKSGSITLSTEPNFVDGQGLVLTPGMSVDILLERHGDAVKKPWYAITSVASALGYLEVTLDG